MVYVLLGWNSSASKNSLSSLSKEREKVKSGKSYMSADLKLNGDVHECVHGLSRGSRNWYEDPP